MYVFPLAGENPIRKKAPLVGVVQSEPDFGDIRLEIEQPTQINKPNRASGEIIRHMCLRVVESPARRRSQFASRDIHRRVIRDYKAGACTFYGRFQLTIRYLQTRVCVCMRWREGKLVNRNMARKCVIGFWFLEAVLLNGHFKSGPFRWNHGVGEVIGKLHPNGGKPRPPTRLAC